MDRTECQGSASNRERVVESSEYGIHNIGTHTQTMRDEIVHEGNPLLGGATDERSVLNQVSSHRLIASVVSEGLVRSSPGGERQLVHANESCDIRERGVESSEYDKCDKCNSCQPCSLYRRSDPGP